MTDLDIKRLDTIIRFALKEDIWTGDVTSEAVIDDRTEIDAVILSRGSGIVCGINVMERIFSAVDVDLRFRPQVSDGDRIEPEQEIAFVEGSARSIMKGERLALNFISMLSGVASATRSMVDAVAGTGVSIYDTRKTLPLHRYLQKYAVTVGGGVNHRKGLWDMVLIKDNHIRAYRMQSRSENTEKNIKSIVRRAKENVQKNIRVEIEVETLSECGYALEESPDVIMLDNMSPEDIRKAVALRRDRGMEGKVLYEVSGGIKIDNVEEYAATGIEIISTGSITGNPVPVDFSLEVILKG